MTVTSQVPPRPAGHILTRPLLLDRQLQILLTLGICGPLRTHQIQRVCAPDLTDRGMRYQLQDLTKAGFVWKQALSDPLAGSTLRKPHLYGITPAGASCIQERVLISPERLIIKEGDVISSQRVIWSHMLDQAEFITRLIADLRHHPRFLGIDVAPEYTQLKVVRIDALITLRYARREIDAIAVATRRPWWVPWLLSETGAVYRYDKRYHIERRIALEIDRSTEDLSIIQRKGEDYRKALMGGIWPVLLREFPIPTFIVRSERRLRSVHQAWANGWWGQVDAPAGKRATLVVATFKRLQQSIVLGDWINDQNRTVTLFDQPHPGSEQTTTAYGLQLTPEEQAEPVGAVAI